MYTYKLNIKIKTYDYSSITKKIKHKLLTR